MGSVARRGERGARVELVSWRRCRVSGPLGVNYGGKICEQSIMVT